MILATFLSFLMYRRGNKQLVVPWAKTGTMIQAAMFIIAAAIVLFYGIRGYFVEAVVRIGYSVYQVGAVLACIIFVTVIDSLMGRGARSVGEIQWGKMPAVAIRAVLLAVTFTWLMGLMASPAPHPPVLARLAVVEDTSTSAHAGARLCLNMISVCVLIFLGLVGFVFWLAGSPRVDLCSFRKEGRMWATNLKVLGS